MNMDPDVPQGGGLTSEQQNLIDGVGLDLPPTIEDVMDMADEDIPLEATSEETTEEVAGTPEPAATEEPEAAEPDPAPVQAQPDVRIDRALLELEQRQRELIRKEQEAQALKETLTPFLEAKKLADQGDRLGAMDTLGLKYEEVTDDYIQGKGPNEVRKLQRQLEATKAEVERRFQEMQAAEQERARLAQRQQVIDFTRNNSDTYAHIASTEAYDLVDQAVQVHYQQTGQVLSNVDAARVVEEGLERLIESVLTNDSLRARYLEKFGSGATTPSKSPDETAANQPTTLDNELSTERTVVVDDTFDPVTASDEELIERLASQLEF